MTRQGQVGSHRWLRTKSDTTENLAINRTLNQAHALAIPNHLVPCETTGQGLGAWVFAPRLRIIIVIVVAWVLEWASWGGKREFRNCLTSGRNCSSQALRRGSATSRSALSRAQRPCPRSRCTARSPRSSRTGSSRRASARLRE